MKEIKNITEEIEFLAHENVDGFDNTELCYKTVFDLFNDRNIFVKVFRGLTSYNIQNKNQIELKGLKYNYVELENKKIYPTVDLILCVKDLSGDFKNNFCFTLTPFNAYLNNETKTAEYYGLYDNDLSKLWRIVMKGFFKDVYVEEFKKYYTEVRDLKEEQIAIKANREYLKIVAEYDDNVNSI